jgi:hypothetical protein
MTHVYVLCSSTVHHAWQDLINVMFDPYRPELHSMRGPGPKWRAKNEGAVAQQ